jgi:GalNAc-alpha-(1->4)-GalNAc-alpha-(1->3)-diNAcBac-PP-undecaprenol alpha-1,4-N-acetyl-D-galactosaminyltransferase
MATTCASLASAAGLDDMQGRALRVTCVIASLGAGGAERVLSELANELAETGIQVTVITLDHRVADHYLLHDAVERRSVPIFWPTAGKIESVYATVLRLVRIRRAVLSSRPDAVLSFCEMTNVRVVFALLGTRIPVIVSERVDPRMHRIGRAWNVLRRMAYRRARHVVVQTDAVARWAGEFVRRDAITVIPNFARMIDGAVDVARESMILAVGRLDRQKGFDMLIEAFVRSTLSNSGWQLTIIGEGPERQTLQAQVVASGLAGAIDLPGSTHEIGAWYERASMFVLSSRYEGFPNVLLEAMSCGLPCIAFDCPNGPAEMIQQGENGVLIAPEDVSALCMAMRRLAADGVLRHTLGERAKQVKQTYSRSTVLGQWSRLLRSVANA